MKKVIYIVKSELHIYPPCVTQIRLLKKAGIEVEVLFGSCNETVTKIFDKEGIPYTQLRDVRGVFKGSIDKLYNYYCFRRSLKKELDRRNLKNTVLWFGNAETLLSMKWAIDKKYQYGITFLELLDDRPIRMKLLKKMAQKSLFNVSCEETRAYIMKAWWSLEILPYVMPNKPFDSPSTFFDSSNVDAIDILKEIGKDKKIILYQGLIKDREVLSSIVDAINRLDKSYVLLLMGNDRYNIIPELKSKSEKVYSGWVTAPNHLYVTRSAYIGIVYYDGNNCLNNAYCAPNKIYEYSAFGIPMLGNNIPGLKNTVVSAGAAICTKLDSANIKDAIETISDNYEEMKIASKKFYESTVLEDIMDNIIKEHMI